MIISRVVCKKSVIKRDSPTSVDCPIRYVFSFDTGEDCRQTLDFSVVAFLKSGVPRASRQLSFSFCMVSTTGFLNSGVYRLFATPFGIKITPSVRQYITLSDKWGAVQKRSFSSIKSSMVFITSSRSSSLRISCRSFSKSRSVTSVCPLSRYSSATRFTPLP